MQVKEIKSKGLKHEFQVTIPSTLIEKKMVERLEYHGRSIRISGFRPGKIPLDVLKKRYGAAVRNEVIEEVIKESNQKVIQEKNLRPALQPQVKINSEKDGADLDYVMTFEALPEIKTPKLDKYSFEKLVASVDKKQIDKSLKNLSQGYKGREDYKPDHKASKGDVVVIDFDGRLEDGKKIEGGSGKNVELELGSNSFIPGFEDQLIGSKAGDDVKVKVPFPKDYHAKELAGKSAEFAVTVNKIQKTVEPKIDDEFAKKLGIESAEKLEKIISDKLKDEYARMSFLLSKRAVLDKLAEDNKFEVPETLVENEFNVIWEEIKKEHKAEESNPKKKKTEKSEDLEDPELKQQYKDIAERRVRLGLLLAEIGRENKVDVTQKELEKAILEQARQYPGQEKMVFDYFREHPHALASLKAPIFEDKVIELILQKAKINEKTVTFEELEKAVIEITQGDDAE